MEVFRSRIEKDYFSIIQNNLWGSNTEMEVIDYDSDKKEFIVLSKLYGLDMNIKHIELFNSINDLTSKNLILIDNFNKVYSLPRKLISSRRCSKQVQEKA